MRSGSMIRIYQLEFLYVCGVRRLQLAQENLVMREAKISRDQVSGSNVPVPLDSILYLPVCSSWRRTLFPFQCNIDAQE